MPHITILLASYNGADHISEQLASISAQTHADWSLQISDDGSTDATVAHIEEFASQEHRNVQISRGPGKGSAANFLSLLSRPASASSWVALCDQDDVWMPEKLARALAAMRAVPEERPALYCSRTTLVSPDLVPIGPSRRHRRFGFSNAVVQNVVAGNTIVLNSAAHALIRRAGAPPVRYHDWWLYLVMSGAGGYIHYDHEPTLLYRQHPANELGENRSLAARSHRAGLVGNGTWSGWVDTNLAALKDLDGILKTETQAQLARSGMLSSVSFRQRARWLKELRPWRQSHAETIALYAAILAGRI